MIDIRKRTAELVQKNLDIPEEITATLFEFGLLEEHICKRVLIREEYYSRATPKRKTELKIILAQKYCVSLATINKYLALE